MASCCGDSGSRPPAAYKKPNPLLANSWEPFDLAFDRLGRAYVTDGANGCIHRFTPAGQWEKCFAGFGLATWIARIAAIAFTCSSPARLRPFVQLDPDGNGVRPLPRRTSQCRCSRAIRFQSMPSGLLHLGAFCAADALATNCKAAQPAPKCPPGQSPERGVFRRRRQSGGLLRVAPSELRDAGDLYQRRARQRVLSMPMAPHYFARRDPRRRPSDGFEYTAEAELADDDIQNLGDVWETNQTATEMAGGEWDCLVRSGGGRFLWLRSNFAATAG